MNTINSKTQPSVTKHIYSSREAVIHEALYRDEYAIYKASDKALTSCYGFIFTGNHDSVKNMTKKDIIDAWNSSSFLDEWVKKTCQAIINRKNKTIIIRNDSIYNYQIFTSIPNNTWKVYYSWSTIDNPKILEKKFKRQLLRRHFEYLLKRFIHSHITEYLLAYSDKQYCGDWFIDRDFYDTYSRENIKAFIKSENINDNDTLIKDRLFKDVTLFYNNNWYKSDKVTLKGNQIPTIKDILDYHDFNDNGKETFDRKMLYSKYCRGTILSFTYTEVEYYWNTRLVEYNQKIIDKIYNPEQRKKVIERINNYKANNNNKEPLWQDVLKYFYADYCASIDALNHKNKKIASENMSKALDKYTENESEEDRIKKWREGKSMFSCGHSWLQYRNWHNATLKHSGYWYNDSFSAGYNDGFVNTQLRLRKEEQIGVPKYNYYVETSRGCKVTLEDAKRLYKIYKITKEKHKNEDNVNVNFDENHIYAGNYQLHSIKYTEKVTDLNQPLHYKEWIVIVGCHHLWIDDFMKFVHYYHLEEDFEISKPKIKLNIKM